MLVVCCVIFHANNNDHGGHQGNTAQALTQWQCLVASCEATVALHQAMLIVLYRPCGMVIEIGIMLVLFVYIKDNNAARKKLFLPHFYDLAKLLRPRPCPTPPLCCPHAGLSKTKKLAPLEGGGSLPWWGCLCCVLCFNFYTNSYVEKPTGWKFFVLAQS
jgi:hypothetical protein